MVKEEELGIEDEEEVDEEEVLDVAMIPPMRLVD
jgi:hypothetical protein